MKKAIVIIGWDEESAKIIAATIKQYPSKKAEKKLIQIMENRLDLNWTYKEFKNVDLADAYLYGVTEGGQKWQDHAMWTVIGK